LQVKTSGWEDTRSEQRVYVRRSSFRPRASTFLCVLGWNRRARLFAVECLLIPSEEVEGLARVEGEWLVLELEPGAGSHRRLDAYRLDLKGLGARVEWMLGPSGAFGATSP